MSHSGQREITALPLGLSDTDEQTPSQKHKRNFHVGTKHKETVRKVTCLMLGVCQITLQPIPPNSTCLKRLPGRHFWWDSLRLSCLASQFPNKCQHPIHLSRTAFKENRRAFLEVSKEGTHLLTILLTAQPFTPRKPAIIQTHSIV